MKYGPLVFLAAFFALALSWSGLVLEPQLQIGREQQETNIVATSEIYPQERPGMARQGREVYRAEGCFYCHSQDVGQTGVRVDLVLNEAGSNTTALAETLQDARIGMTNLSVAALTNGLPRTIAQGLQVDAASALVKKLQGLGAKAETRIVPTGPDISRGWGTRRTVAADFLYNHPVMIGSLRAGPDLANVGARLPDANWQLIHLYAPGAEVKGSTMPPYRFLFEMRKIEHEPSPDALQLPGQYAPPAGFEIVPKPQARMLVAYLLSLQAEVPLFEAPSSPSGAKAGSTNAPAR